MVVGQQNRKEEEEWAPWKKSDAGDGTKWVEDDKFLRDTRHHGAGINSKRDEGQGGRRILEMGKLSRSSHHHTGHTQYQHSQRRNKTKKIFG